MSNRTKASTTTRAADPLFRVRDHLLAARRVVNSHALEGQRLGVSEAERNAFKSIKKSIRMILYSLEPAFVWASKPEGRKRRRAVAPARPPADPR